MNGWHPDRNKASNGQVQAKISVQGLRQLAKAEWSAALSEPLPQRSKQRERSAMRWKRRRRRLRATRSRQL